MPDLPPVLLAIPVLIALDPPPPAARPVGLLFAVLALESESVTFAASSSPQATAGSAMSNINDDLVSVERGHLEFEFIKEFSCGFDPCRGMTWRRYFSRQVPGIALDGSPAAATASISGGSCRMGAHREMMRVRDEVNQLFTFHQLNLIGRCADRST